MHRGDTALDDRMILHVECPDVVPDFGRVERGVHRQIRGGGGIAPTVGDDEGNARFANVTGEIEEGGVGGVRPRIVQPVVYAGVHQAHTRCLASQLTHDPLGIDDVPDQQRRDADRNNGDRSNPAHGSAQPVGADVRPERIGERYAAIGLQSVLEKRSHESRERGA
jgi:hypothetical protein